MAAMRRETMQRRGYGRVAIAAARTSISAEKTAAFTHLSVPMIVWARRIVKRGTPELIVAVEDGRIALYMAARVSRWSPAAQHEFLGLDTGRGGTVTLTARCLVVNTSPSRPTNAAQRASLSPRVSNPPQIPN
jgi:hypothetical protein